MRSAPWAGPALLILGLAGILVISLQPPDERSALGWWILSNTRAYERVLPLVGLGIALALVSLPSRIAALLLFGLGIALGSFLADPFLSAIEEIPGAIAHHFLTGPILSIAVGLSLAIPGRGRAWVLPGTAIIAGYIVGVVVRLTDPSFHNPAVERAGIAFAFWLPAGVCLTVRSFQESWFETAGRILGSWLIAIALLYGGASLIPPRNLAPPRQLQSPPPSSNGLTGTGPFRLYRSNMS